ncbi:MAG TPA: hypothetical protein VHC69_00360 [Polyangiaceae bacterium]|nr:hypothetical protein [Polyangiaceae bacterium]
MRRLDVPVLVAVTTVLAHVVQGCALDDRDIQGVGQRLSDAGLGDPGEPEDASVRDAVSSAPPVGTVHPPPPAKADAGPRLVPPPFDAGADAGECPDDNGDGKPDCQESLVVNWTLDDDTSNFAAEDGAVLSWRAVDANGKAGSGSLTVTDTAQNDSGAWAFTAATQCVPITGGLSYELDVLAFIPTAQQIGGANIGGWFFGDAACNGTAALKYDAPPTDKVGAWTPVSGTVVAPRSARSLLVRLVALKPYGDPPFTAWFDDVHVLAVPTM